ncbi:MAG: TauD/TfdA family dioxygenase [Pseudomonadota bacterium]|uniref:TauD/TfdA dioxygenase family protein n=1 Tax=unclassified Phenylobacterium TaxID=2640670 RepID=UPI0006F83A86|nr:MULTISPECIES: TauD/TfdA family dioxygenase [unclassified Phenylobacterium]KRB52315.1 taurine dioxygenase [Phenylobacterium sp. Root700]MBT9473873.1 TauD/TfdA family dioxygenase [Phenylobacterium sp.]
MSALTIRKVAGALGAEISGVDLGAELSDEVIAEIRQAFVQHQVIFFRDQHLSPDQQLAFGRRFGPLNIHPYVAGMEGRPEVMEIVKEPEDRVNFGGGWHSDMSFLENPSIGSILYAVEIPEWGGDTLFASQAAAYDALSPGLKATLETLNGVHSAGREYSSQGHSAQERKTMKVVEAEGAVGEFIHPIVKVHPETGRKALYVNPAFTMRIEGWSKRESKALLDFLFEHSRYEAFTCRFAWAAGSVAFWDNRSVWHFALNDYPGQRRHMRRVTVDAWPAGAGAGSASKLREPAE